MHTGLRLCFILPTQRGSTKTTFKKKPVKVPVKKLRFTNETHSRCGWSKIPIVVVPDGLELLIADGNHRMAYRQRKGESTILAWVIRAEDAKLARGPMTASIREWRNGSTTFEKFVAEMREAANEHKS